MKAFKLQNNNGELVDVTRADLATFERKEYDTLYVFEDKEDSEQPDWIEYATIYRREDVNGKLLMIPEEYFSYDEEQLAIFEELNEMSFDAYLKSVN